MRFDCALSDCGRFNALSAIPQAEESRYTVEGLRVCCANTKRTFEQYARIVIVGVCVGGGLWVVMVLGPMHFD